jgi:hypothetical protein
MPDEEGLVKFVEPSVDDNSWTTLLIVADIDDQVVGHLSGVGSSLRVPFMSSWQRVPGAAGMTVRASRRQRAAVIA